MSVDVDVVAAVASAIDQVMSESGRPVRAWSLDEALMADIGLDSLDLAVIVVQLEQKLGVDPFRNGAAGVRTMGDVVQWYEAALRGAEDEGRPSKP